MTDAEPLLARSGLLRLPPQLFEAAADRREIIGCWNA
jgi:hypothetical protein